MSQFLFQLKRFVTLPYTLLTGTGEEYDRSQVGIERRKMLYFGLPALLLALIGTASLGWAKFGTSTNLESDYRNSWSEAEKERTSLTTELVTDTKYQQQASEALMKELANDERQLKRLQLLEQERVFLEKLIDINPEELEYRYSLALVSLAQSKTGGRWVELMKMAAPEEQPGFAKAHLALANYFFSNRAKQGVNVKKIRELAMLHAEHCLKRDSEQILAMSIKGDLLYEAGKIQAAYVVYEQIFEKNISIYRKLLAINNRLDRKSMNVSILERVIKTNQSILFDKDVPPIQWGQAWEKIIDCITQRNDFQRASTLLEKEIKILSALEDGHGKKAKLSKMASVLYLKWLGYLGREQGKVSLNTQLELLQKAYQHAPGNQNCLSLLARLTQSSDQEIAQRAKAIYDPAEQKDLPGLVLKELGTQSLVKEDYENAVAYLEKAFAKLPRDLETLNNLAFAHLKRDEPNPKRALQLADTALRKLSRLNQSAAGVKQFRTAIHDTRGHAFMQLGRISEAASAFEIALRDRPSKLSILEALVKCYADDPASAAVYQQRLKELKEKDTVPQP